ncbi:MAG: Serine/threonine-protein kinase PrkC [Planctomycetota bacterium]
MPPSTDPLTRFARLDELFLAARDLDSEELRAFLERVEDPELRADLEQLLRHDRAGTPSVRTIADVGGLLDGIEEPAAIPERLGDYEVLDIVGEGASGIVLRARQPGTDRLVAIKVLSSGAWDHKALARFRREVRILGRLEHPGIARIYDAGTDASTTPARPYFVMELVAGKPLASHVRTHDLGWRGVVRLFTQVVEALAHAHACGVLHRDLKPGNVLVSADGRPKIVDFGVAALSEGTGGAGDEGGVGRATSLKSAAGDLVGTVPYMPPEQFDGTGKVDARSDLYSIGVMLYEALSGRMPYEVDGRNLVQAAAIVRDEVPLPLGRVDRALAGDVETVVAKLLEKEPSRRYQNARELKEDLERLVDGLATRARPVTRRERSVRFVRRYRGFLAATSLAFVALALLLSWTARLWQVADQRGDSLALLLEERSRGDYRRTIGFAEAALRAGSIVDARAALEAAEPARRGWEWDYLRARAWSESLSLPSGSLTTVVRSARGRVVVADNGSGDVRLLDAAGGGLRTIWTSRGLLRDLALSPDGDEFVVADEASDGLVVRRVVDGSTARALRTGLAPHTRVAWSGDGARIACAGVDGALVVLDARDGAILSEDEPRKERPFPAEGLVEFLPVGGASVSAVATETSCRLRLPDGATVELDLEGDRVDCLGACVDAAGRPLVLVGTYDGLVRRFDGASGADLGAIEAHAGNVKAIEPGPRPGTFFTGGADCAIWLWDASTGARLGGAVGSERTVRGLALDADSGRLAAVGNDNHLRLWSIDAAVREPLLRGHDAWVYGVAFLADGTLASSAGEKPAPDGRVALWDRATMRLLAQLAVDAESSEAIVADVADDGRGGAVAAWWKAGGGGLAFLGAGEARSLELSKVAPCSVVGLPGGEALAWRALGSSRITVMARDGAVLQELDLSGRNSERPFLRLSADGSALATHTDDGIFLVPVERASAGPRLGAPRLVRVAGRVHDLALCSADRRIAVGFVDGEIALVDPDAPADADGFAAVAWSLPLAHGGRVRLARTPDGARIASASDQLIRVWDAADGGALLNLAGHGDIVLALSFSPDGRTLASSSIDRTVRLWEGRASR